MNKIDDEYRYFFPRDEFPLDDEKRSDNSGRRGRRKSSSDKAPSGNDANSIHPSADALHAATSHVSAREQQVEHAASQREQLSDKQSLGNATATLLSVYALGQFEFCTRAGILAVETNHGEEELEPQFHLDYLPNYELAKIEEHLAQRLNALVGWTVWAGFSAYGVRLGMAWERPAAGMMGFLAASFGLLAMTNQSRLIVQLVARKIAAQQATANEPPLQLANVTPVNWWSLLRCGWQPLVYPRALRHPTWSLVGNPWRVLHRDSQRIPVVQSGTSQLGPRSNSVYAKHEVRLAAYAALLEATEHVRVPYGLIFAHDSHRGLAVPLSPTLRDSIPQRISQAIDLLQQTQRHKLEPRIPTETTRCHGCELGFPKPLSTREITEAKEKRQRLVVLDDARNQLFHCECADRFGSVPPHAQTTERGLRIRPSNP